MAHQLQEIETWVAALGQYDNHEFEESLRTFDRICDTSKILFNCGMIHATLGQHPQAVRAHVESLTVEGSLTMYRLNAFSAPSPGTSI